jgi:DNA-binding GntR family transcriptional regulator
MSAATRLSPAKPHSSVSTSRVVKVRIEMDQRHRRPVPADDQRAVRPWTLPRAGGQLAEAQAVMNDAATSGDHEALSDADQRFHEILVDASGSTRLRRMATTVLVESRMCMTALEEKYQLPDDALHEHFEIVEALRRGDREAVLASLDAHMERAVQLLTSGSSPDGD